MFEESLYEQRTAAEPAPIAQEGDLFQNYELKTWVPSPRLYKILGASALANVLVLLIFGQTSLLTAKGCDSPLVGSVCQVLDTVYLGTLLLGTQREYVDAAYERTQLSDMDITYVELPSESSKLHYPEGYFELANPEQFTANQMTPGMDVPFPTNIPTYPGIPTTRPMPGNSLLNTPPIYAKPKKDVVKGDLPTDFGDNPTVSDTKPGLNRRKPGSNTPSNLPDKKPGEIAPGIPGNTNTNANAATDPNANKAGDQPVDDQNGIAISKAPLKMKAAETLIQVDAGNVKLDNSFRAVVTGTLGVSSNGRTIILKDPKAAPADKNFPSDPALTRLAQEWVVAVGDAGWYAYLGILDEKKGVGRKVVVTIEQNDANFVFNIRCEQLTPERANSAASSLRNLMTLGALGSNEDQLDFLKSTTTGSDGKFLVVNFEMQKPKVQDMIKRKLAEFKEKQAQPNSTAVVRPESKNLG